jgi:hypothetical protein
MSQRKRETMMYRELRYEWLKPIIPVLVAGIVLLVLGIIGLIESQKGPFTAVCTRYMNSHANYPCSPVLELSQLTFSIGVVVTLVSTLTMVILVQNGPRMTVWEHEQMKRRIAGETDRFI